MQIWTSLNMKINDVYVNFETEGCVYLSASERNRMHAFGSITPHVENASQNPADSSLQ